MEFRGCHRPGFAPRKPLEHCWLLLGGKDSRLHGYELYRDIWPKEQRPNPQHKSSKWCKGSLPIKYSYECIHVRKGILNTLTLLFGLELPMIDLRPSSPKMLGGFSTPFFSFFLSSLPTHIYYENADPHSTCHKESLHLLGQPKYKYNQQHKYYLLKHTTPKFNDHRLIFFLWDPLLLLHSLKIQFTNKRSSSLYLGFFNPESWPHNKVQI